MENRHDESPPNDLFAQLRSLLGGLTSEQGAWPAGWSLESLQRHTRKQLLACAEYLGLTDVQRLTTDALARRFHQAVELLANATGIGTDAPARDTDLPRKFDLGPARATDVAPEHIPWSYGYDRVTAMVVDPDRLYVYWEVTDDAIARARQGLGAGGADAWLSLRVYDVTNRLFDGTNAHGYFDRRIERGDRQWFFSIGKPTSTAIVEIGMKSLEGYFVRITRSGRADFPPAAPAAGGDVQWLTVRTATGAVDQPIQGGAPARSFQPPPVAPRDGLGRVWEIRLAHVGGQHGPEERWEIHDERIGNWQEILRSQWNGEQRTFEWQGPLMRTAWEAGPFTYAVDPPTHVVERDAGIVRVFSVAGRTHVVHGPWQVVIRGLGARAEREVLAVWEVHRWWAASAGLEREVATWRQVGPAGSIQAGASERRWIAGSELRLGGASERWRIGASEVHWLGASEMLYAGASELRIRGASERRLLGASEQLQAGASEARFPGGSEQGWPLPRED